MVPVTTNQNPILDSESMSHFKIFSNWELYPDFLPSDVLRSAVSVPATRCLVEATEANTRDATRDMGVVYDVTYSTKMPQSYRKNMEKS